VSGAAAEFLEVTASARVAAVPLGHLSIELGHLYAEDIAAGPDRLVEIFAQVTPWVGTARERCARAVRPRTPRVSTCFLVDDYFGQLDPPGEVIPQIAAAAGAAGLEIDYLVRESACAVAGDLDVARLVEARLVADPPPGTTGRRPPLSVSGWLSNGQRSPEPSGEAMRASLSWQPPSENGANRHSVFVDVQLWDEYGGQRRWSCAYLASVWQLLRLGLLRYDGRPVAAPTTLLEDYPRAWTDLPAVLQLTERAAPFTTYWTLSVLGSRFMPIETAVRTILSQYAVEAAVAQQLAERAGGEGLALPLSTVDRIEYVFTSPDWR
jgi:hypothetical protein